MSFLRLVEMFEITSLGTRVVALAASATLHVGVAIGVGGHAVPSVNRAPVLEGREVPAPLVEAVVEPTDRVPIEARSAGQSRPTHRHLYPVPPSHDLSAHDPSVAHLFPSHDPAPAAATATEVLGAPPAEPGRFVMTVGGAAVAHGGGTAHEGVDDAADTTETTNGDGIDSPPVLLAGNAPAYPAAAAIAGIEVDVPVAIVIGVDGAVVEARSQSHSGYALDEAALRAVRGYRFSRGLRGGRPVRVRMTWTVMFRLK